MVDFLKNHIVGIFLFAIITSIIASYVYDNYIKVHASSNPSSNTLELTENEQSKGVNLSGVYEGFSTIQNGQRLHYKISINQKGQNINGEIWLSTINRSSYATYQINGVVAGNQLSFEGTKLLEIYPRNASWCMASGILNIKTENGVQILDGTWGANEIPNGCPRGSKGRIYVEKSLN